MRWTFLFRAALIVGISFLPAAFGADGAELKWNENSACAVSGGVCGVNSTKNADVSDVLQEIRAHVEKDMLRLPSDIDACVRELYEEREKDRDAEEYCGDEYARTYSSDEWEYYGEDHRLPIVVTIKNKTGILYIPAFHDDTDKEFEARAFELLSRGATRLYIDLRMNGGGSVEGALKVLYRFAREGDRFLTLRFRTRGDMVYDVEAVRKEYDLENPPGIFRDIPVCVVIDMHSASASEIVAGTMKDWGYCVAGGTSFGKGIGQIVFPLPDGSFLKITAFEYFVGNMQTKIHGIGVVPNAPLPSELKKK